MWEDEPSGNLLSVIQGRMTRGDTAPHPPSGPGSAFPGGWPPRHAGAPGPSPAQPFACRSAPRTAHVPSPSRTAGGSAFPGIPAPDVCEAHTEYVMLGPKGPPRPILTPPSPGTSPRQHGFFSLEPFCQEHLATLSGIQLFLPDRWGH